MLLDRSFFSDHSDIFYVGKILEISEKFWKKFRQKSEIIIKT